MYARAADAAFAANIPPGFDIVGGYYGGPQAFRVWPRAEWGQFPGYKLPIWVGGQDGPGEGRAAVAELDLLGVPAGSITALDMETRRDAEYVNHFSDVLAQADFRVWVYGSEATVYGNPPRNGWWVADYTSDLVLVDQLLQVAHVRAVQYNPAGPYDVSLVKKWTEGEMWR